MWSGAPPVLDSFQPKEGDSFTGLKIGATAMHQLWQLGAYLFAVSTNEVK